MIFSDHDIPAHKLKTVTYGLEHVRTYSEPYQTSNFKHFTRIVDVDMHLKSINEN